MLPGLKGQRNQSLLFNRLLLLNSSPGWCSSLTLVGVNKKMLLILSGQCKKDKDQK